MRGTELGGGKRGALAKGGPRRDFGSSRPEGGRYGQPSAPAGSAGPAEDDILLPGESLAKFRNRRGPPAPVVPVEKHIDEPQPNISEDIQPRGGAVIPGAAPGPRRTRGSLPSWLLAGAGPEAAEAGSEQSQTEAQDIAELDEEEIEAMEDAQAASDEAENGNGSELSDDERTTLSSSLIDAKQDEVREVVHADGVSGGAVFEEEVEIDEEESEHDEQHESDEDDEEHESGEHESHESETGQTVSSPQAIAEAEADAAHENALHIAALGDHVGLEHHDPSHEEHDEHGEAHEHHEDDSDEHSGEHHEQHDRQFESQPAQIAATGPPEDEILLPGETRAPRSGGAPPQEFQPRDSARIGSSSGPRPPLPRPPHRGGSRDTRGRRWPGGARRQP